MRHNVAHRKLGRVTEHRLALLRNQAIALLRHERIETTIPKAKELRPFVERLITIAKRGVAGEGAGNGRALHARRLVLAELPDKVVVGKLFETLAPRFAERPGVHAYSARGLPTRRLGGGRSDRARWQRVQAKGRGRNGRAEGGTEEVERRAGASEAGRAADARRQRRRRNPRRRPRVRPRVPPRDSHRRRERRVAPSGQDALRTTGTRRAGFMPALFLRLPPRPPDHARPSPQR